MRAQLTPEQRHTFQEVASLIYQEVPVLAQTLVAEVERSHSAKAEMDNALTTSRDDIPHGEVRQLFDDLNEQHLSVYTATCRAVVRSLERLGDQSLDPRVPAIEELPNTYDADAAAKIADLMEFDVALLRFFHGSALTSLYSMVSRYLDLCEAYLGREIGTHDAKRRIMPVLRELALAIAAIPAPILGFFDFVIEAFRQAGRTPKRTDADRQLRDAQGMIRQSLLKESLSDLARGLEFDEGMAEISIDGVIEGRTNFTEAFDRFHFRT